LRNWETPTCFRDSWLLLWSSIIVAAAQLSFKKKKIIWMLLNELYQKHFIVIDLPINLKVLEFLL
jgi:hypothetical protein